MTTSTKENTLIFLALLITYFGVYLLSQSGSQTGGGVQSDARWAGFFSVTLGVFSLLTLLFGYADNGTGQFGNIYLAGAGLALLASAFFNYKLIRELPNGNLKYAVYANVVAHVLVLLAYFTNFGGVDPRFHGLKGGFNRPAVYTPAVPVTQVAQNGMSPRIPMRAR